MSSKITHEFQRISGMMRQTEENPSHTSRLDNTIRVQCDFAFNARRVRFAARSFKYARYVFIRAPRGRQRALKTKISVRREKGIFRSCKAAGRGNTGRISRATIQQNPTIHPYAANYTLIALSIINYIN